MQKYTNTDRVTDNMFKLIRESKHNNPINDKQILTEDINPVDDPNQPSPDQTTSDISNTPIPVNDHTFPGILTDEEEKLSQKIPSIKFDENPFMYNPSNNTVSLTGTIPNMANLKFYFTTDTSTPDGGCYIYVDSLVLNDDSLRTLNLIKGHYDIWAKDWSTMAIKQKLGSKPEDIKRLQQQYNK